MVSERAVTVRTGQCGTCCDSSHCLLVEEEQKQQTADRQVARHVLLCLLLAVSLLAVSINNVSVIT